MSMDGTTVDFEKQFWGNCVNTIGEEIKQLVYARKMGLRIFNDWRSEFNIDMQGATVIDIGGGPVSLLLKCQNVTGIVVDPIIFPSWVYRRYEEAHINFIIEKGENLNRIFADNFDEVWIYNVLQHVDDPVKIIENARRMAKKIRLFEWINIPPYQGHPWMLTQEMLELALGQSGDTQELHEQGCHGKAFFGTWRY